MKLAVAQTKPIKGDINANISKHLQLIRRAVDHGAGMIVFPELSITGYEPELAKELAMAANDSRLNTLQESCDTGKIVIGAGLPLQSERGILISLVFFQPQASRLVYAKQYLHEDEYPFFVSGQEQLYLGKENCKIAPAICYEITVPEHAANVYNNGAHIYMASVAKSMEGMRKAVPALSAIAKQYGMTVLLANCTGHCDNFDCGGKSSIWNSEGKLIAQLGDNDEGILILDTSTGKTISGTV